MTYQQHWAGIHPSSAGHRSRVSSQVLLLKEAANHSSYFRDVFWDGGSISEGHQSHLNLPDISGVVILGHLSINVTQFK